MKTYRENKQRKYTEAKEQIEFAKTWIVKVSVKKILETVKKQFDKKAQEERIRIARERSTRVI